MSRTYKTVPVPSPARLVIESPHCQIGRWLGARSLALDALRRKESGNKSFSSPVKQSCGDSMMLSEGECEVWCRPVDSLALNIPVKAPRGMANLLKLMHEIPEFIGQVNELKHHFTLRCYVEYVFHRATPRASKRTRIGRVVRQVLSDPGSQPCLDCLDFRPGVRPPRRWDQMPIGVALPPEHPRACIIVEGSPVLRRRTQVGDELLRVVKLKFFHVS